MMCKKHDHDILGEECPKCKEYPTLEEYHGAIGTIQQEKKTMSNRKPDSYLGPRDYRSLADKPAIADVARTDEDDMPSGATLYDDCPKCNRAFRMEWTEGEQKPGMCKSCEDEVDNG